MIVYRMILAAAGGNNDTTPDASLLLLAPVMCYFFCDHRVMVMRFVWLTACVLSI